MKILHTIQSANPIGGGPIESLLQIGARAIKSGHQVEVVSLDPPDAEFLATFPFPIHALGPSSHSYGYASSVAPWLRDNSRNYDVVVVNGLWQYLSFACWRALHRSPTPYVVYPHGMLDPFFKRRYPLKHLKKWLYWPWGEYRVLRDAAAVLFTCEEERVLARQSFWLYRANERVVAFGTANPTGDAAAQKEHFAASFPELRGKRILLFMGRIHPKKGCDLVIQSFANVLAADSDWHILMAGPDQVGWQAELVALARRHGVAERITWAGMIREDLKWGALRSAEAFFLPSHQENFGIVVAEALACALPVLISDKVNIWREIRTDGAGLVGADNLDGACSLLRGWTSLTKQEQAEMRQRAIDCFSRRFDAHHASDSLLNVLATLQPA